MSKCYFCEEKLMPAPTAEPWVEFNHAGMHFKCVFRLAQTVEAIKEAPGIMMSSDRTFPE